MSNMVQYSLWANCSNACKFCLIKDKDILNKQRQLQSIEAIRKNIDYIDWKDKFSAGISLLGGEIYFITDREIQEAYLQLVDDIIEKILKVSQNPNRRYSTVTNGIYNPTFLYKVVDRIVNKSSIKLVDMNFSYDLKYRFKNEKDASTVLKTIREFHDRYDYGVGVQMILTQYVIDMWKECKFEVNDFINKNIPGNNLQFLYPHPINKNLPPLSDFNFKREDLFEFLAYLKEVNYDVFRSFILSTMNSGTYKYNGYSPFSKYFNDVSDQPKLLEERSEFLSCGHSKLYQCYSNSKACMLCDIQALYEDDLVD